MLEIRSDMKSNNKQLYENIRKISGRILEFCYFIGYFSERIQQNFNKDKLKVLNKQSNIFDLDSSN